jgi:dCTP deaminase
MILGSADIRRRVELGDIILSPFRPECLGPNSYDVHLSEYLAIYKAELLDCKRSYDNAMIRTVIGESGYVLQPGELYLGATVEYTETRNLVPYLDGKSSIGRLGIFIHATAGRGDDGFCGFWTLEMVVVKPVRVYPGMPIGQLTYHHIGNSDETYDMRASSKYNNRDPRPMPSRMYKNFDPSR